MQRNPFKIFKSSQMQNFKHSQLHFLTYFFLKNCTQRKILYFWKNILIYIIRKLLESEKCALRSLATAFSNNYKKRRKLNAAVSVQNQEFVSGCGAAVLNIFHQKESRMSLWLLSNVRMKSEAEISF